MYTDEQLAEKGKSYLEKKGVCCPFCGSRNIEGDSVEIDAGGAYQDVRCLRCEAEWTDEYKLVSVGFQSWPEPEQGESSGVASNDSGEA
jgi:hypothetical protein